MTNDGPRQLIIPIRGFIVKYCVITVLLSNLSVTMSSRKKTQKKGPGRPSLAPDEIRIVVRLDQETDWSLTKLARLWRITRSEALRKAVKERAKRIKLS